MTSRWLVPWLLLAAVAHAQAPHSLGPSSRVDEITPIRLTAPAEGPSTEAQAWALVGGSVGYLGTVGALIPGYFLAVPDCSSVTFDAGGCAEGVLLFAVAGLALSVATFLQGWWSDAQHPRARATAELRFDGLSISGRF